MNSSFNLQNSSFNTIGNSMKNTLLSTIFHIINSQMRWIIQRWKPFLPHKTNEFFNIISLPQNNIYNIIITNRYAIHHFHLNNHIQYQEMKTIINIKSNHIIMIPPTQYDIQSMYMIIHTTSSQNENSNIIIPYFIMWIKNRDSMNDQTSHQTNYPDYYYQSLISFISESYT